MEGLKVGGVAKRAAVNLQTIHYYEREGLLPRPPRAAPELNPNEFVWNHLKRTLANSNPKDLCHLKEFLHPPEAASIAEASLVLHSCIRLTLGLAHRSFTYATLNKTNGMNKQA